MWGLGAGSGTWSGGDLWAISGQDCRAAWVTAQTVPVVSTTLEHLPPRVLKLLYQLSTYWVPTSDMVLIPVFEENRIWWRSLNQGHPGTSALNVELGLPVAGHSAGYH